MKTTGFGELDIEALVDGNVMLRAFSPSMGHFELPMSADELMLFLVSAGNKLADARKEIMMRQQELELQREERR